VLLVRQTNISETLGREGDITKRKLLLRLDLHQWAVVEIITRLARLG
jgi:hypothetical protein